MTTTIIPKDVGEVKDKFDGVYRWQLEDSIEEYIKKDSEIDG